MPEYPDVCVTIPMEAVAPEAQIPLQIKVGLLVSGSGFGGLVTLSQYTRNNATVLVLSPVCIIVFV